MVGVMCVGRLTGQCVACGWVRVPALVLTSIVALFLVLMCAPERVGIGVQPHSETPEPLNFEELVEHELPDAREESSESSSRPSRSAADSSDPHSSSSHSSPARPGRTPSERERARPDSPGTLAARSGEAEADEDPSIESVAGTVFDQAGDVLPGIEVSLIGIDARTESMPGRSARSDRLGMFRFDRLVPGEYEVRAFGGERHHSLSQRVRTGIGSLELHLQGKGEIVVAGRVTDESGQAIPDARIRALGGGEETRSAEDGSYRAVVERRQASQAPVLTFSHPQFREHRAQLSGTQTQGPSSSMQLDVTLKSRTSTVRVEGLVSGPFNEVVSGVTVWLNASRPGSFRRTLTDDLGVYAFERVESNGSYQIGVDGNRDYAPLEPRWVSIGRNDEVLDLRLRRRSSGELNGTLVNPEGRVLPGFSVRVKSTGASDHFPLQLISDAYGGFSIREIEAGDLLFMTTSLPRLEARGLVLQPGANQYVDVVLDWGEHWLFGQVLSSGGQPVPGARVTAQWGMQFGDVFSQSQRETRTDIDGYFAFSNLAAPGYTLTVRAEGHASARLLHTLGSGHGQDLVITLARLEP